MYLQDVGGDENFHLYLQPLDGKPAKDLTDFEGVRAQNLATDKHFPGQVQQQQWCFAPTQLKPADVIAAEFEDFACSNVAL